MLFPLFWQHYRIAQTSFVGQYLSTYTHDIWFHNKHIQRKPSFSWQSLWVPFTESALLKCPLSDHLFNHHISPVFRLVCTTSQQFSYFDFSSLRAMIKESSGKPSNSIWALIPKSWHISNRMEVMAACNNRKYKSRPKPSVLDFFLDSAIILSLFPPLSPTFSSYGSGFYSL